MQFTALVQAPVAELQLSVVQVLLSLQLTAVPAEQTPLWHVSAPLQRSASAQLVPLALLVTGQIPVAGSQAPTVVQAVAAGHVTAVPAEQTPLWQVSAPLQALPSVQLVPFAAAVCVQGQIPPTIDAL